MDDVMGAARMDFMRFDGRGSLFKHRLQSAGLVKKGSVGAGGERDGASGGSGGSISRAARGAALGIDKNSEIARKWAAKREKEEQKQRERQE